MKTNTIRVVAGKYKNRKLKFPSINGLRPTSDQLKETIFNWLAPYIHDSVCVDAFAGSGSLGIESLSRGAEKIIFYELNFKAITQIKENLNSLEEKNFEIHRKDSIKALTTIKLDSKSIIFIDPPFNKKIAPKAIESIRNNISIEANTIIYIETEKNARLDLHDFNILKEKNTSNISAKLITKS
ncbi:16S rRNA (guanine(966)-N(2))-methyltransferase RsmD [Francisella sp. Scap27]|uniref:16S rRNA (guanine(966)-N(2))-methyltransferase RsmD n=1 Tax=Francisella sp. Scap27 TaxID=2589986 RepID=UPI0015BBF41F|nr:16S rRNA (guanine(966)-N(2))-methyltransferase RsmD [Francisella sp. Scap27]QLE78630.1 16S rRNA (guanine(966)-N(2))-methyltransferase RsmD [Francisella sp. Scap27]